MSTTTAPSPTKVITDTVRLSYLHIWEPAAVGDSTEKKYSASLIIPKKDKATLDKIKAAIDAAIEQGKGKWGGKIPKNLKLPLRDGDAERDDEAYEGSMFLNANAKTQPGIVDKNRQKILDQDEVYSGCYGVASITFYPFDSNGNRGIACGLNHIMKVKDGEPLGGRSTAESDFATVKVEDEDDFLG
ncbi:MAG: DUF2815 family protein [Acinetobacter sp.]|uniref:DUF2815 family protein n=1 Tax=Acinetobacter sp. TaxID=472 RepID=UPI000FB51BD4|nr:DUF2815 family protein [Acinetobacter sp.]RUP39784.1 MAG: DUF2815 family protein [Acinetobacter sp.]